MALVDTVTGRVTLSGTMLWPPVVGGALPAVPAQCRRLRRGERPRLLSPVPRSRTARGRRRRGSGVRAAFDATQARRAGAVLAAEHACVISLGDTLGGGYYDLARVVQSRGALADRVAQLSRAVRGRAIGDLRSAGRDAGVARAQRSLSARLP